MQLSYLTLFFNLFILAIYFSTNYNEEFDSNSYIETTQCSKVNLVYVQHMISPEKILQVTNQHTRGLFLYFHNLLCIQVNVMYSKMLIFNIGMAIIYN